MYHVQSENVDCTIAIVVPMYQISNSLTCYLYHCVPIFFYH